MIKIITQKLEIESNLKQRLEFICDPCHIKPTYINKSIRKIDKTYKDCSECYIRPNLVLIYKYVDDKLILVLFAIGSHSELFDK